MTVAMRSLLWVALAACVAAPLAALSDNPPGTGKPQYGTWGFDAAGEDKSVKPGDDFFRYANGTWLDKTQIPPDKPGISLRLEMTDRTEARLHDMMEKIGRAHV